MWKGREVLVKVTAGKTDIGDYLKATACTLVMFQSLFGFAMKQPPTASQQWGIGLIYDAVKFTAPAFIFGILYTIIRVHAQHPEQTYGTYYRRQWSAMFVPTIWWTLAYLLILPQVQQRTPYINVKSFLWQAVNGNAAPHLWYNSMMLQFILLMPLFWALSDWAGTDAKRGWWALAITGALYAAWLVVFPHVGTYLVDRVFLSFLPYGVAGTLGWRLSGWLPWFDRYRYGLVAGLLAAYGWITWQLVGRGLPVRLAQASYYQWSMTVYAFAVILAVAVGGYRQMRHAGKSVGPIHWLATYAYRAFLSHVFWLTLIWGLTTGLPLVPRLLVCYSLTWLAAFASAYGFHLAWQALKRRLLVRNA
ncbi:hypothetical protein FD37_GL001989 [Levilactobacillus spicheri DSM 15429]|uniref:Acyltransferase 3 domain-containing protein n=1 Tax=Levilactobacillus spicheri DSM 15429 TaxID=1423805 RepID=A0A0R1R837_9LACO|nr:hypothetical protein FD37_GL001989 [Levilactobacillus spicheri DSM 15429]